MVFTCCSWLFDRKSVRKPIMCEESLSSLFVCASQWKQKAPKESSSLGASVCLRTTFSCVNCNMCCENLSKLCYTILEAPQRYGRWCYAHLLLGDWKRISQRAQFCVGCGTAFSFEL